MRFDDRLKTVLGLRAANSRDRAVRWRQLVELVARGRAGQSPELIEKALEVIRADADSVDEQLRASTARAIANAELPPELIATFASDTLSVAAPLLSAVDLDALQWERVLASAKPEVRRFAEALHPQLAVTQKRAEKDETRAPAEAKSAGADATAPEEAAPAAESTSISELVARIERLRQARQQEQGRGPSQRPDLAAPGSASVFRWECDSSGEIAWVDGAPRGPLVGRSIAQPNNGKSADEAVRQAFRRRAPFRDARLDLSGAGAVAGEWEISGVPAFEPADGRFAGYRGIARRAGVSAEPSAAAKTLAIDHDSLRELVHEIKTPLNAIIGFAEIIDGQYLGPADHSYRQRAAQIVAQARLLLTAVEDLDVAAKLKSAGDRPPERTDLGTLISGVAEELRDRAGSRGASLKIQLREGMPPCALELSLAERIVRRFLLATIDAASESEEMEVDLGFDARRCLLAISRPQQMRGSEDELLSLQASGEGAELTSGFSLRLVRGLVRLAGGDLSVDPLRFTLTLPRANA